MTDLVPTIVPWWSCWFRHRWTKWQSVTHAVTYVSGPLIGREMTQEFQRRKCMVCGKIQEEEV